MKQSLLRKGIASQVAFAQTGEKKKTKQGSTLGDDPCFGMPFYK